MYNIRRYQIAIVDAGCRLQTVGQISLHRGEGGGGTRTPGIIKHTHIHTHALSNITIIFALLLLRRRRDRYLKIDCSRVDKTDDVFTASPRARKRCWSLYTATLQVCTAIKRQGEGRDLTVVRPIDIPWHRRGNGTEIKSSKMLSRHRLSITFDE